VTRRPGQWFGCEPACYGGNTDLAVEWAWDLIKRSLRPATHRITDDVDERKDLLQEALVELWAIDPTRFDLREPKEVAYLRRMLINRMWDVWRSERQWREVERS
jgi:DNA-directed RNA polymerase specialized sigma24 family protein